MWKGQPLIVKILVVIVILSVTAFVGVLVYNIFIASKITGLVNSFNNEVLMPAIKN